MAIPEQNPHFVLLPLMAQGHMIPMVDIARLLANRGITVTILTTAHNANRFQTVFSRVIDSGLDVRVHELRFPSVEAGLPEGCENFDLLPSDEYLHKFFTATGMLKEQVENLLQELKPFPSCLVADQCFPWSTEVSLRLNIPRLIFQGISCFSLACFQMIAVHKIFEGITSDSEYIVVRGLPDRIEITKTQALKGSVFSKSPELGKFREQIQEAEKASFGFVANTFEELETEYVKEIRRVKGKKVWCVGPVSLCNNKEIDKVERGKKASIDVERCLEWLESRELSSVIYVCLGSILHLPTSQLIELGLGLEASNRPFIWVIRNAPEGFLEWIAKENFEDRVKDRGLLIHGWAPQVLILSHPSVGGFLTHCGWNSTLEGIAAGVPLITWPLSAEQFFNEKFVVNVIKTGIRAGTEAPIILGQEENVGAFVKCDKVKAAIDELMDGGEEGNERRKRAQELGEIAERAMEEGGSSWSNITLLVQDVVNSEGQGETGGVALVHWV